MFNPFRDYFYYTKSERNGSIGLVFIGLFFFILPSSYSFIFPVDESQYVSYNKEFPNLKTVFAEEENLSSTIAPAKIKLFSFDPNTATKSDFRKLGLKPNTIQAILNYRAKGGKFYQTVDLKKIYTFSEEDYLRLESHISIALTQKKQNTSIKRDTGGIETPIEYTAVPIELFHFDPNTAEANTFLRLGLSKNVANNILRYRATGGKFYSAKSLQKIYGLDKMSYEKIAPFVDIEPIAYNGSTSTTEKKIKNNPNTIVDINQASIEEWQQLYGVGKYVAEKIVNFRNLLGGFSSIEQVSETYAVRSETFEQIKSQLRPSPVLKKLKINLATPEELKIHPYLSWTQAQTICNFRKHHGSFMAAEELVNTKIITLEESLKLAPYLDFSLMEK